MATSFNVAAVRAGIIAEVFLLISRDLRVVPPTSKDHL